jgi:hypothetical protein
MWFANSRTWKTCKRYSTKQSSNHSHPERRITEKEAVK